MLLALLLIAQQGLPKVPPPMRVDEEPSAFACSYETVLRGAACTYEAAVTDGDARENSRAAALAGQRACAVEAGRDEGLRKDCEKAVAEASLSSKCAVSSRLADSQGRLAPPAQACAEMLRAAVSQTSRAAALSLSCCACLAESRCSVSPSRCKRELAELMPGAALRSCLQKSCQDACSFVTPARAAVPAPAQESAPPPPPENPNHPSKI